MPHLIARHNRSSSTSLPTRVASGMRCFHLGHGHSTQTKHTPLEHANSTSDRDSDACAENQKLCLRTKHRPPFLHQNEPLGQVGASYHFLFLQTFSKYFSHVVDLRNWTCFDTYVSKLHQIIFFCSKPGRPTIFPPFSSPFPEVFFSIFQSFSTRFPAHFLGPQTT